MKKSFHWWAILLLIPLLLLSGCSSIGDKTTSMSVIYCATTVFSLLMFISYCVFIKKKEIWFLILFASVMVVNIGYLMLSVSGTLEEALFANRVSYLGSVFLPLSMIMIIMNISKLKYKKWLPGLLTVVSVIVFLVAASPGFLDIYYKSVTLENINGVSVLNKEYGSWHCAYLFYLIGCFTAMISTIIYAIVKKKLDCVSHAVIIVVAVFVNICVWLLEQLVKIDFEFLSVSYIISGLFLIGVYLMIQHQETVISSMQARFNTHSVSNKEIRKDSKEFTEHCQYIVSHLPSLTKSERTIYNCYLAGKTTKEILQELNIAENTLKFHNKNLYGKLGVSSRKQLIEYAKVIAEASATEREADNG